MRTDVAAFSTSLMLAQHEVLVHRADMVELQEITDRDDALPPSDFVLELRRIDWAEMELRQTRQLS